MPDSLEQNKTYLLDDVEVVFTGRTAKRVLKNNRVDERYEVTPSTSGSGSWKRWVRSSEVYKIEEKE